MTVFTERFSRAVDYARIAHAGQVRKGTTIPYLTHLLGVATLVIEFGGSEDQAIAGLLHDTIEDCGAEHEVIIRAEFGDAVADIVVACTDGTAEGKSEHTTPEARKGDWLRRKQDYLAHLAEAPDEVLLCRAATSCITYRPSSRTWKILRSATRCSIGSRAVAKARCATTNLWFACWVARVPGSRYDWTGWSPGCTSSRRMRNAGRWKTSRTGWSES